MTPKPDQLDVGVIGVGSMGQHHARVYNELPSANLVGVFDVDDEQAESIAWEHDTHAMDLDALLDAVDAVSIVVPTQYHYDMAVKCLDAGVATFIEKPVLGSLDDADAFQTLVREADVPVQVGHIERFNPAVSALSEILPELSIVSIRTQRLGPPPGREIEDSAVMDLMIHDIDIVLSLLDESPAEVHSTGVDENRHAAALLEFESGAMASLTASRKTQRKVRTLEITAEECFVELDYIEQSIEIHRNSVPEYIQANGDVRFKHESIVERPMVSNAEPLRKELEAFLAVTADGGEPEVTVADGIEALEVALWIEDQGLNSATQKPEVIAADD
ncbi:Gfo/Idh/MocA family oxidoreductase [Natrialbaceae archaeon A-CW1-1]